MVTQNQKNNAILLAENLQAKKTSKLKSINSEKTSKEMFENLGGRTSRPIICKNTDSTQLDFRVTNLGNEMHHSYWRGEQKFGHASE